MARTLSLVAMTFITPDITMLALIAMLVLLSRGSTPEVSGTKLCPVFAVVEYSTSLSYLVSCELYGRL